MAAALVVNCRVVPRVDAAAATDVAAAAAAARGKAIAILSFACFLSIAGF